MNEVREEIIYHFYKKKAEAKGVPKLHPFLSSSHNKALDRATEQCIKLGADPENYIRVIFAKHTKFGKLPDLDIDMLGTPEHEKAYFDYEDSSTIPIKNSYDIQMEYLRKNIEAGRKVENILMDKDISFSAWFRICITKEPFSEVIEKYREEAREEMTPQLMEFLTKQGLDSNRIRVSNKNE